MTPSPDVSSPRDDDLAWLRLTIVPGITPQRQQRLLRAFGTPQEVLARDTGEIEEILGEELALALARGPQPRLLQSTLDWLSAPGHRLLALGDPDYPRMLLEIAVPPTVLYAAGRVDRLNAPAIAIVGSRNATREGIRDAEGFASALSEAGLCIASGLALGIDAAAHRGGLAGAGSSVAVIGTGPDRIYPPRNEALARELAAKGCIVSEFPLGTPPLERNFPRRNRLISGLARGVLVVEAAERSGSLLTARAALEQDRDVFAIPGSIHSPLARGCHMLIKQGAKLVDSADDILSEYGLAFGTPEDAVPRPAPLIDDMGPAPVSIDQLAARSGLDAGEVAATLARLEIEGRIAALGGGWFQRIAQRSAGRAGAGGAAGAL